MRIVVYLQALNGVTFHRLINPYLKVKELSDISVSWLPQGADVNKDNIADLVKGFDVFVFSRVMPDGYLEAIKSTKVKTVCDCDDYWELDLTHPLYKSYKLNRTTVKIVKHLLLSDYVTTTTQLLADKIKEVNPNVFIFENGLCAEGQFAPKESPHSDRVRFGIIGSSSHTYDMQLLEGINSYLTDEDRSKILWVLCGFDEGRTTLYAPDGTPCKVIRTPWENVCWAKWEKMLTADYRYIDEEHMDWLKKFLLGEDDIYSDGYYRRLWTRDVDKYATFYDDIDVLIAPLQDTNFNKYKSELKMIEAAVKHKCIIVSKVAPYTNVITDENCIAVKNRTRDFAKAIKTIVNDPQLAKLKADRLSDLTAEGSDFNLEKITYKRIQWLQQF